MASFTLSVASVQISISSWRRSSSVMTPLRYWVSTLSARASYSARISALFARGLHVLEPDGEAGLGGEAEPELLDGVEGAGHVGLVVVVDQLLDQIRDVGLEDHHVDRYGKSSGKARLSRARPSVVSNRLGPVDRLVGDQTCRPAQLLNARALGVAGEDADPQPDRGVQRQHRRCRRP